MLETFFLIIIARLSSRQKSDNCVCSHDQYTLEEHRMVIKNGQSRDPSNIGYTRHRTKTNKAKNTTQTTKMMSNTDSTKNQECTQVCTQECTQECTQVLAKG